MTFSIHLQFLHFVPINNPLPSYKCRESALQL